MSKNSSLNELVDNPNQIFKTLTEFFSYIASKLNAEVILQPIELCIENTQKIPAKVEGCLDALATNYVEEMTEKNSILGYHKDYDPEKGVPFALINKQNILFPCKFKNGEKGMPWLVSVILYVTNPLFKKEMGMGTVFINKQGKKYTMESEHMRIVLFPGNIQHGIGSATDELQSGAARVSYVYKLALLPKIQGQCLSKEFHEKIYEKSQGADAMDHLDHKE